MTRIRVLVVGSRLLRDIVEHITADHPDIEVLDHVPQPATLENAVRESQAAVIVWAGDDQAVQSRLEELLYTHPPVRLLVIQEAQHRSFLCELRPHKRPLGELGPDGLIAAIRDEDDFRRSSSKIP